MAQSQQSFNFRNVFINKSHSLGSGSYGKVYMAKGDQLSCAAKVMHQALSSEEDAESVMPLEKFQTECYLLSLIRHPNIVQYLSTSYDDESGQPVLLMELCDESLTMFLDRSPGPLAYHTELSISHDIALALAYLHCNGLVHRDLSSNNVLMNGDRAKVSDFGMSKLQSIRSQTDTVCPGSVNYMPPEALDEPPSYTEKLDVFSFGVLLVQIMTRKFPDPGPRFRVIDDPRYSIPVRVPIREKERRQAHLVLIDDAYSLKSVALKCLRDNKGDRPTAKELSTTLGVIKPSRVETRISSQRRNEYDGERPETQVLVSSDNLIEVQLAAVRLTSERVASNIEKLSDELQAEKKELEEWKERERKLKARLGKEKMDKIEYSAVQSNFQTLTIKNTGGDILKDSTDMKNILDRLDSKETAQDVHADGQVEDDCLETMELPYIPVSDVTYETTLAEGGQATVWKGMWRQTEVAIKKYAIQPDPRDVQILQGLPTHPNIVRVLGVVKDKISCSIIMELITGGSLHNFLHQNNELSCQQRFSWMQDIALGMEFLHSREIAHKDLKSPNVLLAGNEQKTAMLCDFGTARHLPNTTVPATRSCTPRWVAPEIVKSVDAKVNKKCDVFSFSMVLCEIVTLELPFKDLTEQMAMMHIVEGKRPSLPQSDPNCPPFLYRLITTCWNEDPKERPSFREINSALNCKKFPQ